MSRTMNAFHCQATYPEHGTTAVVWHESHLWSMLVNFL